MSVNGIRTSDECGISSMRSKRRDLFELFGIYALILLVIWTPRPWQGAMWGVAAACTFYIVWLSYEGLRPMGLCADNLTRSLWAVALAVVLAMVAVVLASRWHTLHVPTTPFLFFERYGPYILWAGVQQLILQCFFLTRALRLLPNATSAAALSAGLFAIAHLPNPVLTIVTLICGMASCLFFVRHRNLWPLAVAHAILGISIAVTIPGSMHHNMRVGIGYLTYIDRSGLPQTGQLSKPQRPH
jgi:membrane protease YdiL (CAAX protease family)